MHTCPLLQQMRPMRKSVGLGRCSYSQAPFSCLKQRLVQSFQLNVPTTSLGMHVESAGFDDAREALADAAEQDLFACCCQNIRRTKYFRCALCCARKEPWRQRRLQKLYSRLVQAARPYLLQYACASRIPVVGVSNDWPGTKSAMHLGDVKDF